MNFASGVNPGGNSLRGHMSQEEAICYCSNLYMSQLGAEYYIEHNGKTNKYSDAMQISNVTCFKDSKYNLTCPITSKVLSASAINLKRAKKIGKVITEEEVKGVMLGRCRKVLQIFEKEGCKDIIIGAFGCGSYGLDAKIIASIWNQLFEKEFYGTFRQVISSIPCKAGKHAHNHNIFKEVLSGLL